jgi:glycosyltransferase involved in cell wall biosynthesis
MILGIDGRLANAKRPAGAGHYCREVLRALGEMDAGLWLRVYLDDEPVPELPVRRDRIRMLPRGPLWTHRILANELRSHPPDVFFSPLAQVPWRCPCPSLVTVLDLAAWSHPSFFPWRKRLTMKIQARHAIGAAGHLVGISEATATDLAQRFRLDPARITVVPLGCGERFFNPAPAEPGTILSTLPESYVLYLGQVQPRKNLLRLIAAFERVLKAHPDLPHHLVLAGGLGWQNEAIYRSDPVSGLRSGCSSADNSGWRRCAGPRVAVGRLRASGAGGHGGGHGSVDLELLVAPRSRGRCGCAGGPRE